ncbi:MULTISPECIES: YggS family pyridoxal phosphate-dependent enzyme [unclassified Legionella]|uniref:YggS family pyridoxal phosphate-dependent enzyme n=1 Tax=unclassified Legionella TaxID=2622702 RepID=UPI001E45B2C8|nr:YggS family pyridoxal phosphate-dependent enzyme [Legionella sp. 31fI33]MCC5014182.1 YggS family pyridoxal phosphate-dependent enzyme [Legionella sp. 31fI33]
MTISDRVHQIQTLITTATERYEREANTVKLLAVSKGQSSDAIKQAFEAGISDFGENYLQEAQVKIHALSDLAIHWHFIGPIQSNKTRGIAQDFEWVHSVGREEIAMMLAKYRPAHLPALNICLQINLDEEESKSGVSPIQAEKLALFVGQLPSLTLRGLMTIPRPQDNTQQQYESFLRLASLLADLNKKLNLSMDTLSMGMSDDFEAAIRAGSTLVRIGRAIFGERQG